MPVSVSATPNPSRVPSFIFQFLQSGWFGRIYTVDITCPHCGEEVSDNFAAYHGEIMDPDTNPFSMPHKVIPCLSSRLDRIKKLTRLFFQTLVYAPIPGETQGLTPSTAIWVPSTLLSSKTQAGPHRICVIMGPPSLIGQECLVSEISPYEPLTVKVRTWSEDVVFGDGGGMDPLYSKELLARISARPDSSAQTEAQLQMMAALTLLDMSGQGRLGGARL